MLIGLVIAAAMASAAPVHAQIPPGYEIIRLTDDPDFDDRPAINNYGQVVWSKRIDQDADQEEIYFWDGVRVHRITDNNVRDAFPDLNDHGTMVWSQSVAPGDFENLEIALLRDGELTLLTDNNVSDRSPSVNNLDHIAWSQRSGLGCNGLHLMYYDGTVISQISEDDLSNQVPMINNRGQIAWVAYDWCVNPWMSTIKLFSNGRIIHLTTGDSQDQSSTISDRSDVAWSNGYPNPIGIALWADGTTRRITESGRVPSINVRGDIAFTRFSEENSIAQQWLWMNDTFIVISDPDVPSLNGVVNDCGEVSFRIGDVPNMDLVLMRMLPGDSTRDGTVTIDDYASFASGMTGPRSPDEICSEPESDVDGDGDVDLRDFALRHPVARGPEDMFDLISCLTGPIALEDFCSSQALDVDRDRDIDLRDFAAFQTRFQN